MVYVAVVFGAVLSSPALSVADTEADTMKAIQAAWTKREQDTRTATFVCKQKGRFRRANSPEATGRPKDPSKHGNYINIQQTLRVALDGERFSMRLDTKDAHTHRKPTGMHATFDGKTSQIYEGDARPGARSAATVTKAKHAFGTNRVHLRPILMTYRPLHRSMYGVDLKNFQLLKERAAVGEDLCVRIAESGKGPIRRVLWLDSKRDFVVRRYESLVENRPSIIIDVSYTEDPRHGWVPTNWKVIHIREDGELGQSTTCTVSAYAFNQDIPKSEFRVRLPEGTYVVDRVAKKTYFVGEDSPTQSPSVLLRLLLIGSVIVVVAILCRFFWLRRRRSTMS
ncbi:MAG: hypothetical protein ACE5KM_03020 [Planctomycetaceae bacterium]